MHHRLSLLTFACSIAVSATLIQAPMIASQTSSRGQDAPQNTETQTIRVTTRLVQVNVVVHDKKGEPVGDLTKDDFILLDKGQEQKIQFFSKESSEAVPTNTPPLPAGVFSNRYTNFTSGGQTHLAPLPTSLTVILLDGLNTAFTDQHYAKEALIKFLNQLQPGDRVAIYTLTNGLRVLHDFTSDTASLLSVLAKHRNEDSAALNASTYDDANSGDDNLDAFLDRSNEAIANFYQARRVETTLSALEAIAHHLAGMPGRKNLIWLSGGFPTIVGQSADGSLGPDFQTFSDQTQRATRTINDIGLAIYPVDARGLMGPFATMPSMSPSSRGGNARRGGPRPVDQRAQNQLLQTQGTMREIADGTGGRAFINTNDLTGAIRRAMQDARVTYVLAYTPSHDQWDGKFREIKIKLKRPSLEARYRKGYYAYPENPTDPKLRQAVLGEAAGTPLASTGLGLLARVAAAPTPENRQTVVRVVMDANEIAVGQNAEGKHEATIDLLLVVFDDKGKPLHQVSRTIQLNLEEATYTQLRKNGISLDITSEAPEKSTHIRLIAHDVSSGSVGSIDLPLK
jgi:VWFA-related protein